MSAESWKSFFDVAAVVLLFMTFAAGFGALFTGRTINRRQEEKLRRFDGDLTQAKSDLATQQERAATAEGKIAGLQKNASDAKTAQQKVENALAVQQGRTATAERELIEAKERERRRLAPRWAFSFDLIDFLKDKPSGSFEILFAPEDNEASQTGLALSSILAGAAKWRMLGMARPYTEADILPEYREPNPLTPTLYSRIGGLADVMYFFSSKDLEPGKPFPRAGTAAEALWRGLIACGYTTIFPREDPRLAAGTVRIVIGHRN